MFASVLLASVLAVGAAPDAAQAEAKRFEGVWVCKSARVWGEAIRHDEGMRWEFRADTRPRPDGSAPPPNTLILRVEVPPRPGEQGPQDLVERLTIDPSTEPKGYDVPAFRAEGVYRFTPEGLEMCESPRQGRPRPRLFSGETDPGAGTLFILVRQGPKAKGGQEKSPATKSR
jgi:uncharacterized protein (TIGR03067 family)